MNDNLLDPEIIQNSSPYYKLLREQHPCYWNERWRGWVLTRYEDVRDPAKFEDPERFDATR